jgi:hypothetical protein
VTALAASLLWMLAPTSSGAGMINTAQSLTCIQSVRVAAAAASSNSAVALESSVCMACSISHYCSPVVQIHSLHLRRLEQILPACNALWAQLLSSWLHLLLLL